MLLFYLVGGILLLENVKCQITLTPVVTNFQACCGNSCKSYSSINAMFGVSCCQNTIYNTFDEICCSNTIQSKRSGSTFADRCCGTATLSYTQTCCNNIVSNVQNGLCCGNVAYSQTSTTTLCCSNTLFQNVKKGSACCGSGIYDGGINQICCGTTVQNKNEFDSCCKNTNNNPPTFAAYKSSIQTCCSTVQAISTTTACCFLRKGDVFLPTPYQVGNQCCTYPYLKLGTVSGTNCIVN